MNKTGNLLDREPIQLVQVKMELSDDDNKATSHYNHDDWYKNIPSSSSVQQHPTIQDQGIKRKRRTTMTPRKVPRFEILNDEDDEDLHSRYYSRDSPEPEPLTMGYHKTITIATNPDSSASKSLPFMGQMTLDHCPRRGRKPKKADICHLIAKNYSVTPITKPCAREPPPLRRIFPATPSNTKITSHIPETITTSPEMFFRGSMITQLSTEDHSEKQTSSGTEHGRQTPLLFQALQNPPEQTTPAPRKKQAEVSICKFKFTGGPCPTLEKKKMLSVDSGGKFHFYNVNGAGNSSGNRNTQIMQVGTFTGEAVSNVHEFIAMDTSNQVMESTAKVTVLPSPRIETRSHTAVHQNCCSAQHLNQDGGQNKRRPGLRRKMEETFKDKGFLIQTQKFDAPQGATFCKFRQLKKFTRYLFRNWKDHLPTETEESQNQ